MLTDNTVISGKMYSYVHDDIEKVGVIETFIIVSGIKHVVMDTGDQIPLLEFKQTASIADEDIKPIVHENIDTVLPNMPIKYDKDGFPILKKTVSDIEDVSEEVSQSTIIKISQKVTGDPVVLALIEKANKVDISIVIDVKLGSIDKDLYKVIEKNFGEEAINLIHDYIINHVNSDDIKNAISEKIKEHYK